MKLAERPFGRVGRPLRTPSTRVSVFTRTQRSTSRSSPCSSGICQCDATSTTSTPGNRPRTWRPRGDSRAAGSAYTRRTWSSGFAGIASAGGSSVSKRNSDSAVATPGAAPRGGLPFRCQTARVSAPGPRTIDLNADLGEGFGVWRLGDDDALLQVVSSANVACGFHAGDPVTMRRVCAAAAVAGVSVGAQVSYRDLAGFGRRFVDVAADELAADVLYQLAALDGIARTAGTRVSYVKPHGALYNAVVHHEAQARAVVEAVAGYDPGLAVLGLPGSVLLRTAAAAGLRTVREGFADRAYTPDGTLVPRGSAGALVHDPAAVAERAVRMAADGVVVAVDGSVVPVEVASVCVHGDTPGAVDLARSVRAALESAGLVVAPFAG